MGYAVVIPSCNRPEMLRQALKSVYKQTLAADRIYLVIDEIEDRYKYSFLEDFDDRLEITFTGGGFGGARARNVGLEKVYSEFVFFLDDDDKWLPQKTEKQIGLLSSRADAVAVTCDVYRVSGNHQTIRTRDEEQMNRCVKLWNYVGGFSCFGMRRRGDLAALRLSDDLACAQDHEFYIRISQFGRIVNLTQPQVIFMDHDAERVSGNRLNKRESYLKILQIDRDLFTFRERCFLVANAELMSASERKSFLAFMYWYCKGMVYLLLAMEEPRVSSLLWFASIRSVLRTLKRPRRGLPD